MEALKNVLVMTVGLLHLYFFYLECFLWTKPKGLAIFQMSLEQAQSSATLASNQGVYNALLGVGLLLGLFLNDPYRLTIVSYILVFIAIAGVYGGITVSPKIFFVQVIPAVITVAVMWIF